MQLPWNMVPAIDCSMSATAQRSTVHDACLLAAQCMHGGTAEQCLTLSDMGGWFFCTYSPTGTPLRTAAACSAAPSAADSGSSGSLHAEYHTNCFSTTGTLQLTDADALVSLYQQSVCNSHISLAYTNRHTPQALQLQQSKQHD
eukprot:GHRR01021611.1.p2 GENE.GHRR01021611.1~~GHRR01021611.1.p2  ORF type:complete len:144 (-),score=39.44 GHRR01021611.1:2166-2597(-)